MKGIYRQPILSDFLALGFTNIDGALYKDGFKLCIQFWDKRWWLSNTNGFIKEIDTVDTLNNIIIKYTNPLTK